MELHQAFLYLALILFLGRLFGEISEYFGIPAVLGEILVGLILGPSLLGVVPPDQTLKLLAELGIILLLFQIGLEADFDQIRKVGLQAFLVAVIGALLPLALGFLATRYLWGWNSLTALFAGGTLAATSIGITVRLLKDLGILEHKSSQVVLAAAVIDDILGVLLLSALYEFAQSQVLQWKTLAKLSIHLFTFFLLAPIFAHLLALLINYFSEKLGSLNFAPGTVIALIFFMAYLSHQFGAPEILGAFTGGLAFSRRFVVPFAVSLRVSKETIHRVQGLIEPLVFVLTPIFFVYIGLGLDFRAFSFSSQFLGLLGILTFLALLSKTAAGLAVRGSWRDKFLVGVAMVPRGEVGLIFAEFGKISGVFNPETYALLVTTVALTTLAAPLALKFMLAKGRPLHYPSSPL